MAYGFWDIIRAERSEKERLGDLYEQALAAADAACLDRDDDIESFVRDAIAAGDLLAARVWEEESW